MSKDISELHHNIYEYADALARIIKETPEETIKVDKDSLQQLSAAYQHLYVDVYINQRIRPVRVLIPKQFIQ